MSYREHEWMPEDHMDKLYNSSNLLVRYVHVKRLDTIAQMIPPQGNLKILDAGCGEGHLIDKLHRKNSEASYYGIDIAEPAMRRFKERCPYAELRTMDLITIGFEDEFFDIIICSEVLEHIHEYETVTAEMGRTLKKGGNLIITFPNERLWTFSRFLLRRNPVKEIGHINSFNPGKMKAAVKMKPVAQVNLPFGLPFWLSLGCLMKFEKQ